MQFSDPQGTLFTLVILDYQFPETTDALYDSNWLLVEVDVTTPERSWRAHDPCLLTYEVEHLAQGFEQVSSGIREHLIWDFLEPCLQFEIRASPPGIQTLRITFDLDLHPDWNAQPGWQRTDLWIECPVDSQQLIMAAQALRQQLARYPQRAER